MKRLLVCLLVCALALAFAGCGDNAATVDETDTVTTPSEEATESSDTETPDEETPDEETPAVDVAALYTTFLNDSAYEEFLDTWTYGEATDYALLDIDGDEVQELILTGTDGAGFSNFAVFYYDAEAGEINVVKVPNTTRGDTPVYNVGQYYGVLKYSPTHHALVYAEMNNSTMFGGSGYYTIVDHQLDLDFSVSFETNADTQETTYKTVNDGESTPITEEEYLSYAEERAEIEWVALP